MKNVDLIYLVGDENISIRPFVPYAEVVCDFLNTLSQELHSNKANTAYPDVISFAFWCRKANIVKLKTEFEDNRAKLGRGLVFHITPSNVPINFAFSFVFGLLSGNGNIVRVPSRPYPQVDIICRAINQILTDEKYAPIKAQTVFVKYPQNDEITAHFSAICNARVIWGGDAAIQNIHKFPITERGVEIAFPDRYSFCVINADAILDLDEAGIKRLADGFYNDTYLIDQNACSSPHLVIWQGKNKTEAKTRFWKAVYNSAQKYDLQAVSVVDKFTQLCHTAIEVDNIKNVRKLGNLLYCVELDSLPGQADALRGRFGLFYEYDTDDLNSNAHIVNTKYQTLTYFGVNKDELLQFVLSNHLLGIDRIVPIGSALDIGVIWDGYDIVGSLSRIVEVK